MVKEEDPLYTAVALFPSAGTAARRTERCQMRTRSVEDGEHLHRLTSLAPNFTRGPAATELRSHVQHDLWLRSEQWLGTSRRHALVGNSCRLTKVAQAEGWTEAKGEFRPFAGGLIQRSGEARHKRPSENSQPTRASGCV